MRCTWWLMSCQLLDYPTKETCYVYLKSNLHLNVLIEMESILTRDLFSRSYSYCIAFFHIWVSLHASSISYVLTSLLSWLLPPYYGFRYGLSGRHRSSLGTPLSRSLDFGESHLLPDSFPYDMNSYNFGYSRVLSQYLFYSCK